MTEEIKWEIQRVPADALELGPHEYLKKLPDVQFSELYCTADRRPGLAAKAKALGIGLSDVCTTYIFESRGGKLYAAVVPGDCDIDMPRLHDAIWSCVRKDAERMIEQRTKESRPIPHLMRMELEGRGTLALTKARTLPYAMRPGSCGPFPSQYDVVRDSDGQIKRGGIRAIVYDVPDPQRPMECVAPGKPDISFMASMADIATVVDEQFPSIIAAGRFRKPLSKKPVYSVPYAQAAFVPA